MLRNHGLYLPPSNATQQHPIFQDDRSAWSRPQRYQLAGGGTLLETQLRTGVKDLTIPPNMTYGSHSNICKPGPTSQSRSGIHYRTEVDKSIRDNRRDRQRHLIARLARSEREDYYVAIKIKPRFSKKCRLGRVIWRSRRAPGRSCPSICVRQSNNSRGYLLVLSKCEKATPPGLPAYH